LTKSPRKFSLFWVKYGLLFLGSTPNKQAKCKGYNNIQKIQ
jgi:hypothetical protein